MREGRFLRKTGESHVEVRLVLEGAGIAEVGTPLRFLDHMLEQWCFHSRCDLTIDARSLDGIAHHVVEDVALCIGSALDVALGERRGIARYGFLLLPMDEALAQVAVDLSGRPFARVDAPLGGGLIDDLDAEMVAHFFSSFAQAGRLCLHARLLAGENRHHCVEALFKALARACAVAWSRTAPFDDAVPSTKGSLQ